MDEEKVFCAECRYLQKITFYTEIIYDCCHPENITYMDTWLLRQKRKNKKPQELNQNNDCKWFTQKEKDDE